MFQQLYHREPFVKRIIHLADNSTLSNSTTSTNSTNSGPTQDGQPYIDQYIAYIEMACAVFAFFYALFEVYKFRSRNEPYTRIYRPLISVTLFLYLIDSSIRDWAFLADFLNGHPDFLTAVIIMQFLLGFFLVILYEDFYLYRLAVASDLHFPRWSRYVHKFRWYWILPVSVSVVLIIFASRTSPSALDEATLVVVMAFNSCMFVVDVLSTVGFMLLIRSLRGIRSSMKRAVILDAFIRSLVNLTILCTNMFFIDTWIIVLTAVAVYTTLAPKIIVWVFYRFNRGELEECNSAGVEVKQSKAMVNSTNNNI